jgi:cellulose synthase/poly-beta-1,6-N-acetylglucosamine synthase-like glycosyltransferase
MSGLVAVLLILLNLLLLPYFVFLMVVSVAALLPRRKSSFATTPSARFLIVIPAHDEAPVISNVVKSCLEIDYPRSLFDVLVIADNCSDGTALLAGSVGARVFERFDESKKSKGHAIDDLIVRLEQSGELDAIDALVIVDADTMVSSRLLVAFDEHLRSGHDWIQAYYTVANPDDSWRTQLLRYAFSLFNGIMPLGNTRLGLGALLKGNGMCFSVRGLRRVPWHSHGLVEDLEYAWDLRIAGEKVMFEPDVAVYGAMLARGGEATANQRRRWEFGRREVRKSYLMPLLRSRKVSLWSKAFGVCDLTLPTLSVLAVLYLGISVLDVLYLVGLLSAPVPLAEPFLIACVGLSTLSLGLYAISPFLVMRLPWRYAFSVCAIPFYLCWKLWISIRGRPDRWVRTPREPLGTAGDMLLDPNSQPDGLAGRANP